ncbi:MAG TPA: glycosyltransferase family 2 protein, partial [Polyangia bacterium]|nr:glycosyltransferase family 2 protein [Polyangia bacterium]
MVADATPLVSIVIPVFNKWELTWKCLMALSAHTRDVAHEVIVIDNASSDATAGALPLLDGIRLARNETNLGFARASNQGAALARGKYILFLNNDTEVQPGWLAPMIAELDHHPAVALVGSKLLYPDGTIQHGGVIFTYAGPEPITPLHLHSRQPAAVSNRRLELRAVTAACMLARPEVFRELGGFDEAFVNGGEDVDLCLKVWRSGRKIVFTPDSVVVHHESVSDGRFRFAAANADRLNSLWIDRFDAFDIDFRKFAHPVVVDPARPGASVIVVVHDALWTVAPCLENVRFTIGAQDELIVVDDASHGASARFVAQFASQHPNRVRLIRNDRALGFSRAAGRGRAAATRPYAALLGANMRVVGDWIDRLRVHLEARSSLGALSATLGDSSRLAAADLLYPINATDPNQTSARGAPGGVVPPRLAPGDVDAIRYPCSVTLFGRRERLTELGRLDPDVYFADDLGALADLLESYRLTLGRARDVVVYKFNQNAPNPDRSIYDRYLALLTTSTRALATIVVRVGAGAHDQARACVDTITRYADRELEIKVVADGDPRTGAELSSEHAAYVAVLGHDAIVTPGWLGRQVALLAVDPTLSVVGPAMNDSPGPQRIGMVTYRRLDDLPAFAACWALEHRGEHTVFALSPTQGLDPLCQVMTRRQFIGDLDSQMGRAPLKAGIAFDAFVHRQA